MLLRAVLVAACLLCLAAPAHAAKPTASLKPPTSGDLTLAHLVFATKGGSGTPKLALTNKSKLSKQLTVIGGVKKLKKNSYLASVVVLNRKAAGNKLVAAASTGPALKLSLPKGMTFSKFTSQVIAKNLLANSKAPKFCGAIPKAFDYIAKKSLAGALLDAFSRDTREYAKAGYQMDCPVGYSEEELGYLTKALRGESINQPASGDGGGSGGGEDGGEEDEGEGGGIPQSSTLTGSGTVTSEGNRVYAYTISFNEPVYSFQIDAWAPVDCPTLYGDWKAECDALGNSQSASAGNGMQMPCTPGEFSYQFGCATPRESHSKTPPPTIPAGTPISGRFRMQAGTPPPGTVRLRGIGPSGQSAQVTLGGP